MIDRMRRGTAVATWLPIVAVVTGACSGSGSTVTLPPSATCSTGPVTDTTGTSIDAAGENLDTTCGSLIGSIAWKMGAAGSPCKQPIDCSPACCACSNASFHVLASYCDHGTCAAPEGICCAVLGTAVKACGG
jgi:hypothetical protein